MGRHAAKPTSAELVLTKGPIPDWRGEQSRLGALGAYLAHNAQVLHFAGQAAVALGAPAELRAELDELTQRFVDLARRFADG